MDNTLQGFNIIITRAPQEAQLLAEQLSKNEAHSIIFPCIECKAHPYTLSSKKYDYIIFTSKNAVSFAENIFTHLQQYEPQYIAIGEATAQVLAQKVKSKIITPPTTEESSEGLLSHAPLKNMHNKNILIIKGVGGRNLLYNTLSKNNRVDLLNVYTRSIPTHANCSALLHLTPNNTYILASSVEVIQNFLLLTKGVDLKKCRIIAKSERIAHTAQQYFSHVIIANLTAHDIQQAIIKDNL